MSMSAELQARLETTTIAQWQARQIEKAASILAKFVESTHEDKLTWRPATGEHSVTRSVLEQVAECVFVHHRFQCILRDEPLPTPPESFDRFRSAPEAIKELKDSAKALAELVRTMDTAALARDYNSHRGPMPGAMIIQFPIRNMTYHMGQINMIQLLYGDAEFHIDAEFITL